MRKKPDILLLLVVVVVSGVVISNFVVFKHDNRISSLRLLNAHYSTFELNNSASLQTENNVHSKFRQREVVRIDLSKQQIH
ncbi:MAG: hypothetical protein QNL62_18545 [Gammaproteobacteria bacterium]|nr:hypothetical protein [Gammaproteobacteria bacterium]